MVQALHQDREFQDIPRRLGVSKHIKTGLADFCLGAPLFVKTPEKSLSHHENVVGSLSQGRNLYREHSQAVIQVSSEFFLFCVSREILMGGARMNMSQRRVLLPTAVSKMRSYSTRSSLAYMP